VERTKLKTKCKSAKQRTLCVTLKMNYFLRFGKLYYVTSLAIGRYVPGMYAKGTGFLQQLVFAYTRGVVGVVFDSGSGSIA
jgi:hypothetical protein